MKNKTVTKAVKKMQGIFKDGDLETDDGFYMEYNSFGELSVKGCRDISNFTEETLLLISDMYYIDVKGKGLQIKNYSVNSTVVTGVIDAIGFTKR